MDKEKLRALLMQKPELAKRILQVAKSKGYFKGGRVGFADGSSPQISQQQMAMIVTMLKKGADMSTISSIVGIPQDQVRMIVDKIQQGIQQKTPGGIAGYKYGGIQIGRAHV